MIQITKAHSIMLRKIEMNKQIDLQIRNCVIKEKRVQNIAQIHVLSDTIVNLGKTVIGEVVNGFTPKLSRPTLMRNVHKESQKTWRGEYKTSCIP